jgi:predicted metal-dependent hydrolase
MPHLERFLNRVMAKAAASLKGDDPATRQLREDIRMFIRQEANHYALHEQFNTIVTHAGYDVSAIDDYIAGEYDRLLKTKSLAFCLAYCEGFETMGPPFAHILLGGIEDLLEKADPEVVGLWKWHLMEEFEHRTVCFDTFHAFHGGYFLRLYGFFYQSRHLAKMTGMVRKLLLAQDCAEMSAEQRLESERRLKLVGKRLRGTLLRGIMRALSPWYRPHGLPEPRLFRTFMAELEPRVS